VRRIPEKITELCLEATTENLFYNTQKALERIGCLLNNNAENKIFVENKNSGNYYKLVIDNCGHEFFTIYELCKFIRATSLQKSKSV
jgi:hypothetical protein